MKHRFSSILIAALAVAGCKPVNKPTPPSYSSAMQTAYLEDYGPYYASAGLEHRVFALDAYSEGLTLNRQGLIEGSGTNFYLSDIFVADSLLEEGQRTLPAGVYESDDSGEQMTFLPGQDFEGQIAGAYVLRIDSGRLVQYTLLTKGALTVSYAGDTAVMHFEGITRERTAYTADFRGKLKLVNKTQTEKARKAF